MGKIVYQVSPEWEDLRIDKYLTEQSEQLSRSYIQKLIKEGHLYVNDQMCRSSYKVKEDDVISFDVPENTTLQVEAEDIPLDILNKSFLNKLLNFLHQPLIVNYH